MKNKAILNLLLLLCIFSPAMEGEESNFSFSGDNSTIRITEGQQRTLLSGNARIEGDDFSISADSIELYGPSFRYIECYGDVHFRNKTEGMELRAPSLSYDREKKHSRISGYTELLDTQKELSATAYYMEQDGITNEILLQTAVQIDTVSKGEKVSCQAEMCRYQRDLQQFTLLGSPLVEWKGDEYRAEKIEINTRRDSIRMSGSVSGSLHSGEENDDDEAGQ